MIKPEFHHRIVRVLLALVWGWLALTSFSELGGRILLGHLGAHSLLAGTADSLGGLLGPVVGTLQLAVAALLLLPARMVAARRIGALASAGLAAVPLTLLFTNPVWMESLGGFPAIGSGQGLLKYAVMVGLSLHLAGIDGEDEGLARAGEHLTVAGLILPLLWIGGMKFTAPEAQGIEGLMRGSPFFSWLYEFFSVQGASNVIGITELVTVGFLSAFWFRPRWSLIGGLLAAGTFLGTLSFLITVPGWNPEAGFPLLNGAGVFLIKDLALLAASVLVILRALLDSPRTTDRAAAPGRMSGSGEPA